MITGPTCGRILMRRLRRVLPRPCAPASTASADRLPAVRGAALLALEQADPITQVSIPHASRDSFIKNPNAGLVFWLVPYGLSLVAPALRLLQRA